MLNMIQADIFKMYKSSAIKVLFIITVLCSSAMTIIAYMIPQGKVGLESTGIGFLFSDMNMISILGAAVAGIFICSDFENKTVHAAITSGSTRAAIIVSKALSFFFAIAFILLPYVIATTVAVSSGNEFSMGKVGLGFLNLLCESSKMTLQTSEVFKLVLVMLTFAIVYIAQLSICMPLAILLRKPVFVVVIYYGLTILFAQLMNLKSSALLKKIFSVTPYDGKYVLLTIGSGTGDVVKALLISAVFISAMLFISYAIFRKAEIK